MFTTGRLDDDRHDRGPRRGRVAARPERIDRGGVEAHLLGGLVDVGGWFGES